MNPPTSRSLGQALGRFVRSTVLPQLRGTLLKDQRRRDGSRPARPRPRTTGEAQVTAPAAGAYPGDFEGVPVIVYAPHDGDLADPGEVVWTWVPYEEDHSRGKDRPVLIIARDPSRSGWLLGLSLTSQDHDRDEEQEARAGRYWVDVGTGGWDRQGRPSEARVNRIIRVDPAAVRRIAVSLSEDRFAEVARAVAQYA